MDNILLSPDEARSFTPTSIFGILRAVFHAKACARRKVYWMERGFGGRMRLRQVMAPRERKGEDRLIGVYPCEPDVDVAKLAIAASCFDEILTGIRWELYDSMACEGTPIATGRFDHVDLLPENSALLGAIIANHPTLAPSPKLFDLDGLTTSHACPRCQKAWDVYTVMFLPAQMESATKNGACKHCGLSALEARAAMHSTAKILLHRLCRTTGTFDVADESTEPGRYLELMNTAVAIYYADRLIHSRIFESRELVEGELAESVAECIQRSMFTSLQDERARETFIRLSDAYIDDGIMRAKQRQSWDFKLKPSLSDDDYRQWLIQEWESERQSVRRELEYALKVPSLLFASRHAWTANDFEAWRQAISGFGSHIETLLSFYGVPRE